MGIVQINKNPSARELKIFGIIWLLFFGFAGIWLFKKNGSFPQAIAIWTLAAGIGLGGQLFPGMLRVIHLATSYIFFPFGWIVSLILLAVIFYLILTPLGFFMRLLGHDPMGRKFNPRAQTYWLDRDSTVNIRKYFRQY